MAAPKKLRDSILALRKEGKSYRHIQAILKCSKSTIHFHCNNNNLTDTGKKKYPVTAQLKKEIQLFLEGGSIDQAVEKFKLSKTTIYKAKKIT